MKRNNWLLIRIIVTLALAISILLAFVQPSYAQSKEFFCDMHRGKPTTFVHTIWGNVPIISWIDDSFPSPWTPLKRCQLVSARFEKFYQNGTLKYLKAGNFRGQPILCVAGYQGGECLPDGVLVTLKPGVNPWRTLQELHDKKSRIIGQPIMMIQIEKEDNLITEVNGSTYLEIKKVIKPK